MSEILMLRRLALKPGLILFVVPFIALVEEKTNYFHEVWKDMYIGVRSFHGDDMVRVGLTDDIDVAVCTIERANILLNQLFHEKKENQLTMIVIDEIHMLSDKSRGFLLEVILSKIKYLLHTQVQIVGMSATLPNIHDFSTWLQAELYTTEYRPVNLHMYLAKEKCLYKYNQPIRDQFEAIDLDQSNSPTFSRYKTLEKLNESDYDCFLSMVFETLLINKSVMVFCSSKKKCEESAKKLSEALHNLCFTNGNINPEILSHREKYFSSSITMKRNQMLEHLGQTAVGLCPILLLTVRYGKPCEP